MNKHKWRVGIMTEMAPVGYVGVSPKCILGFNKNMGEEISLRLRTDDLKGFRKYESIKKTLLHELAHMVHSEHDANFFALNKQLNEEAASLDWTKSRGHMLNGRKVFDSYEDEFVLEPGITVAGHRLGGELGSLASARALSGAAAYQRFLNASAKENHVSGTETEYNPVDVPQDFVQGTVKVEPDPDDAMHIDSAMGSRSAAGQNTIGYSEPNDVGKQSSFGCLEPDPEDSQNVNILNQELRFDGGHHSEPDPDDGANGCVLESGNKMEVDSELTNNITVFKSEPDPDDSLNTVVNQKLIIDGKHGEEPDPDETTCLIVPKSGDETQVITEQSRNSTVLNSEPDPDDHFGDLNSNELQRIEEPVAALCARLQKSIEMLRLQATPTEADSAIQTLFRIIKNVIEHPNDIKYKSLRKSNPHFQRSVANYKAAMEVLELIGFCEDVVSDEIGRAETYLVLKRNDPGLLWLAKSSLEVSLA